MAVEVAARRRRFTRKEYWRMAEVGILGERVELIEGEIVEMSPIGRRHRAFVYNLNRLLAPRLPDDAMVFPSEYSRARGFISGDSSIQS